MSLQNLINSGRCRISTRVNIENIFKNQEKGITVQLQNIENFEIKKYLLTLEELEAIVKRVKEYNECILKWNK